MQLELGEPKESPLVKVVSRTGDKAESRRWLRLRSASARWAKMPSSHSYPLFDDILGPESLSGLRWSHLLFGLMRYIHLKPSSRLKYEPALLRLATLVTAPIPAGSRVAGHPYGPRLTDVDLTKTVLKLQCQDLLLTALAKDGIGVAFNCYRPLCLSASQYLASFCLTPERDGTVAMRENLWEYALDQHAMGFAQMYNSSAGRPYRSYWKFGIGLDSEQRPIPEWFQYRDSQPLPPSVIWTQLTVAQLYGGNL